MSVKHKKIIALSTICLLTAAVVWMMFQPLISAYLDGVVEKGTVYVYGISFLNEFGAQGVLVVAFPFLLMLAAVLDIEKYRKDWICCALTFASLLAYIRSLAYAKQWLCTEISWYLKYHVGVIIYPFLMISLMFLVIFWIYQNDEEEYIEEMEEVELEKDSEIWESIKKIIREETSPVSYETWIEPCKLISISGDKLVIQAENGFFKEMLERRYCGCFQRAAEIVLSEKVKEVVVSCL